MKSHYLLQLFTSTNTYLHYSIIWPIGANSHEMKMVTFMFFSLLLDIVKTI